MPLKPGKENIPANIHELTHHGSRPRSHAQIVAIAEAIAKRHAPKRGLGGFVPEGFPTLGAAQTAPAYGGLGYFTPSPGTKGIPYALQMKALEEAQRATQIPHTTYGSPATIDQQLPDTGTAESFARGGGGNLKMSSGVSGIISLKPPHSLGRVTEPTAKGGFIHSAIPGRTDRLAMNVKHGSHVIPADVVSSLGQGNSLAGARHLDMMLRALPQVFKKGGTVSPSPSPRIEGHEPILAAGGEYIVPPEEVRAVGNGDHKKGHNRLDKMIVNVRHKEAKRMLKLPPPKK